jgi:hypothetical protein
MAQMPCGNTTTRIKNRHHARFFRTPDSATKKPMSAASSSRPTKPYSANRDSHHRPIAATVLSVGFQVMPRESVCERCGPAHMRRNAVKYWRGFYYGCWRIHSAGANPTRPCGVSSWRASRTVGCCAPCNRTCRNVGGSWRGSTIDCLACGLRHSATRRRPAQCRCRNH